MPIDYKLYHPDWKEIIRPDILKRDKYKCAFCGVKNKAIGYRDGKGNFTECDSFMQDWAKRTGLKLSRIVLTIAHLDHDRTNNDYLNLKALCQRCHLNYDRLDNILKRKQKR